MQDESAKKLEQLYLGPAIQPDHGGPKVHPSDFRNAAILVHPHPNHRINIDIELRNHGNRDVEHVAISLYMAEVNLGNLDHEQASALLRNIVKNSEPIESWSKQVVPHSSGDPRIAWRIPGGSIQAKLHEGSYGYSYVVVVCVGLDDLSFLESLPDPHLDVSKQPRAAVWSSALPGAQRE